MRGSGTIWVRHSLSTSLRASSVRRFDLVFLYFLECSERTPGGDAGHNNTVRRVVQECPTHTVRRPTLYRPRRVRPDGLGSVGAACLFPLRLTREPVAYPVAELLYPVRYRHAGLFA